jgi:hypothetical protein
MAQKIVYVCDRCGDPRFVKLQIDVAKQEMPDGDEVASAFMDLCARCTAAALKNLMQRVPIDVKAQWHDWLRVIGRED